MQISPLRPAGKPTIAGRTPGFAQQAPAAQSTQDGLRFGSDAFRVYQRLQLEKEAHSVAAFKEITDRVVWKRDDETLRVADMLAFLCRTQPIGKHSAGQRSLGEFTQAFPGLDETTLKNSLDQLHAMNDMPVGKDRREIYWLRPSGVRRVEQAYPDTSVLPPQADRSVLRLKRSWYW